LKQTDQTNIMIINPSYKVYKIFHIKNSNVSHDLTESILESNTRLLSKQEDIKYDHSLIMEDQIETAYEFIFEREM
jgi:hypothetical protein